MADEGGGVGIKRFKNPWRDKYREAAFRNAQFFVETDARQGGRRVALHEYPKRNVPYAEDMGRKALRFLVQGYLIGPKYLDQKNLLVKALEKDGPGMLRLPLPYEMQDVKVMVMGYTVTEARETGGYCKVDMDFAEYGDPQYRQAVSTAGQIEDSAFKLEDQMIGPAKRKTDEEVNKILGYAKLHTMAQAGVRTTTLSQAMDKMRPSGDFGPALLGR
jgi:prophage DNA circulation protein